MRAATASVSGSLPGNRYLALDGLDQELLVAADAQAFDGRNRQCNAVRFETVPLRCHRLQLGVDGRQQGGDAPFRASAMERWNQLRCVAARYDQTPFRRHEIEAGGQGVHVGHVQFVLGREALPDADGCGATRAGDQDAHLRSLGRCFLPLTHRAVVLG
jgi:hypothetical protein